MEDAKQMRRMRQYMIVLLLISAHALTGVRSDEVSEALEFGEGPKQQRKCKVQDHGAIGDGKAKDTSAIQGAIDACAAQDGGIVEFEAGKSYLSGSLRLASKVTLNIEGATLLASIQREDYPVARKDWSLLLVDHATQASIEGNGRISGQILQWTEQVEGQKMLSSWADESCMDIICRPNLITVRDSSQVTLQGIKLAGFVHTALHIQTSEAVAVLAVGISTEPSFRGTEGIVVDGSKRVFIGETSVTTGGSCIAAITSSGTKQLESLLIDNVVLQSEAAAFQVGPTVVTDIKTIVMQNAVILPSHRGLSIQLQGLADMHDMWFTNVTITSKHFDNGKHGAAEAIHVSVKPASTGAKVGKMSNVWFGNVTAKSEGGFLFSGDPESNIDGITVKDTSLTLTQLTKVAGSYRDFRPSQAGLVNASAVPAILLENANHVQLSNIEVSFESPGRKEWGELLEMKPHTVHALTIEGLHMHDEAAHTSTPFVTPMKTVSQLGVFFTQSVRDWVKSISSKGFISMQENAALGVTGRKAAGSASPVLMGLLLLLLVVILFRYCCIPAYRGYRGRRPYIPA